MIGQTALALKLKLQEILVKFQEEQKNIYSLLNQNQLDIDAKKKELEALMSNKRKLENLPSLDTVKRNHINALQQLIAFREPQLETLKKGSESFDDYLQQYAQELSALNNQLEQNLLRMQSEETQLRALIETEKGLMEAIQRLVAFQSTLMNQCLEKLQGTKVEVKAFLREHFSDSPILKEQLILLEQEVSVRPETSPEITEAEHLLRAAKRTFALGVKQLDDLMGEVPEQPQNTILDSLSAPFFSSPVKYARDSDKTTAIKSIAFYVPVVKVELPYLQSLEQEKARGEALQQQLKEMELRFNALQSAQRELETKNTALSTANETHVSELSKTKAVLEEKSAELLGTVERFQTLEAEHTQLKEKHSKLETACEVLTANCVVLKQTETEKQSLLQKKETMIASLSTKLVTLKKEKHTTEEDLKQTLLKLISEKDSLVQEKGSLAEKLRENEQALLVAQAEKERVEETLKLQEAGDLPNVEAVEALEKRLLLLSLPNSPSTIQRENTVGISRVRNTNG